MILDGYSRIARVGQNNWLVYRPMIREERDELERLSGSLDLGAVQRLLTLFCEKHVYRHFSVITDEIERLVYNFDGDEEERADVENLRAGAAVALARPWLADPAFDCAQCRHWWYDPAAGRLERRGGVPLLRPADMPPRCETPTVEPKCPRGHWSNPIRFSEKNAMAFRHWQECRAVGRFPDDAIVARNARVIQGVVDDLARRDSRTPEGGQRPAGPVRPAHRGQRNSAAGGPQPALIGLDESW